jgi:hypothetical protein
LLVAANRRSHTTKNERDTGIIKIEILRVISLGMDVHLTVLEVLAFEHPIITQSQVAAGGLQLFKKCKGENAEGQASKARPGRGASNLREGSIDDEPPSARDLTGNEAEHSFENAK